MSAGETRGVGMGKEGAAFSTGAVFVAPSRIHGDGIFTDVRLAAGQLIARLSGRTVRDAQVSATLGDPMPNIIGLGPGRWVDPSPPFHLINHSCVPNVALTNARRCIALRDIDAGEELTLDYSTTESDAAWTMTCSCGEPACRGVLRAIQFSFDTEPVAPPLLRRAWSQLRSA